MFVKGKLAGLAVAASTLAGAASALGALSQGKYSVKTHNFTVSSATYGGDYLKCAKGKRVVSGGAFWHASGSGKPVPDAGFIANSAPTTDGKGWYAIGFNQKPGTLDFEEVALCLPSKAVGHYKVKTHNFVVSGGSVGGGYVKCAKGERVVSGGAFWHASGSSTPMPEAGAIYSSTPTTDGKGSYATGYSQTVGNLDLEGVALCLPSKAVGHYTVKTHNFTVPSFSVAGGYVNCAKGERVVSGGAFWHASGSSTPIPDAGPIQNSAPTTNGKGWYATGRDLTTGALDLQEVALCL